MRNTTQKNKPSLLLALLTCLLLMACLLPVSVHAENDIDGIVAVVDNKLIMHSDLDRRMQELGVNPQDKAASAQVLKMMIEDIVVEKSYKKFGFPPPDSAQVSAVAEHNNISYYTARAYMMRRSLTDTMVSNRVVVTEQMIKDKYESDPRYAGKPAMHLKELIFGPDMGQAEKAKAAIIKGMGLKKVADKFGSEGDKSMIDLGFVPVEYLEPEILQKLDAVSDGEFIGPVKVKDDYCIFQRLSKRIKGGRDLEEVRSEIITSLENEQRDEAFNYWLKQIMTEYYIGIYL